EKRDVRRRGEVARVRLAHPRDVGRLRGGTAPRDSERALGGQRGGGGRVRGGEPRSRWRVEDPERVLEAEEERVREARLLDRERVQDARHPRRREVAGEALAPRLRDDAA